MADNLEKEVEGILTEVFKGFFTCIKVIFGSFFCGIKKLKNKKVLIGFLVVLVIAVLGFFLIDPISKNKLTEQEIKFISIGFMALPFTYLLFVGSAEDKAKDKMKKCFQDIGFKGRDNKYPYLCGVHKNGKKLLYVFKSNIPINDWKSNRERLEQALDCNIMRIEYGENKKIIKLTTVPNECKIPEMIEWNDSNIQKSAVMIVGVGAIEKVTFNLNRTPHVLIAGETGSGKSVILRELLWQMIYQGCRLYMIDFKGGVEFGKRYEKYGEVVTERERALEILSGLVYENQYRLTIFRDLEVKNLDEYNRKTNQHLCRVGVFIDEIAEMLDKKGMSKEDKALCEQLEGKLSTLARLSRATGINLFIGVQRPDANVLTGQIKNNIPVRICGRFADRTASEIVLGNTDATELPDIKGRFLYKVGNETIEFQSFLFDDDTMLKDISVEVGDMLTEAPVTYEKPQNKVVEINEKGKKKKFNKEKQNNGSSEGVGENSSSAAYSDADLELDLNYDYDEELPF